MTEYLVPFLFLLVFAVTLSRRINLYDALADGAGEGLRVLARIAPTLVVLLSAVSMLRASGALELLAKLLSPVCGFFRIPVECLPIVLVRPLSGSAALAVALELMQTYGPDSRVGLTAAVMLGATETTFYTITVYFGAARVRATYHTILPALLADCTGFLTASLLVRIFFPNA